MHCLFRTQRFKLRDDETGNDFQPEAQSGFLWGGAAFSKQVQAGRTENMMAYG